MIFMKKFLIILCLFCFMISLLSCDEGVDRNVDLPKIELENEVKILVPTGSTYIAVGGALASQNVSINIAIGPKMLPTALANGSYDIIVAPLSVVPLLKSGNSPYKLSHILTLGNLYIVSRDNVKLDSIMDLVGEEVYAFGEAAIPGKLLKKVYSDNGLDTNNIKFDFSSSSDVYSAFAGKENKYKYVVMSEPDVCQLEIKENIKINKLDLSKVLGFDIAQAAIFVNPNSNNIDIDKVLNLISSLVTYLNTYPELYADSILKLDPFEEFNALGKEVIKESIPLSNIVFKEAKSNKELINKTLISLSITGDLSEEFYR